MLLTISRETQQWKHQKLKVGNSHAPASLRIHECVSLCSPNSQTQLCHPFANRLGHFAGADGGGVVAVGLHVGGHKNTFFDDAGDGAFELCGGGFAEMFQQLGFAAYQDACANYQRLKTTASNVGGHRSGLCGE
jgi:hypothetical protein